MDFTPQLRHDSDIPLYRQIFVQIAARIRSGELPSGDRLPATRELAGLLGLNRTTISAAYEMLETEGLIAGHVGRGSFVTGAAARPPVAGVDWSSLLDRPDPGAATHNPAGGRDSLPRQTISFATSRPSRDLFPLGEFRATCAAVMERADLADILQLGSPGGYEPLRRYLLDDARRQRLAGPNDDLLITNGCQQALDLIGRVLLSPGDTVAVEDPVYPGLKNLLADLGAQLAGVPVSAEGLEVPALARILQRERPRLLVVTPKFQNPTGATLPLAARHTLLDAARAARVPVVENDPY
ncbi:MAG: PLP-dependent aminotransferase family protein, partial [Bryobacteraceae bacterium]